MLSSHRTYKAQYKSQKQRQKLPDGEHIDMAKIVKDDKPRYDSQKALETKRQLQKTSASKGQTITNRKRYKR